MRNHPTEAQYLIKVQWQDRKGTNRSRDELLGYDIAGKNVEIWTSHHYSITVQSYITNRMESC